MIIQLKNVIATIWKYAKSVFIIKILIAILTGLKVPVTVKVTQNLIDNMIKYVNADVSLQTMIFWSGVMFAVLLADVMLNAANQFIDIICDKKLTNNLEPVLIEKYRRLDYANYEDKNTQDIIHRMSGQPYMKIKELFIQMLNITQAIISSAGLIIIYVNISIILVALMVVLMIPILWLNYRMSYLQWELYSSQTEDERILKYLDSILTSKISLFELKVYKALNYIVDLWNHKTSVMLKQKFDVQKKNQRCINLQSFLSAAWYCAFIIIMLTKFFAGGISIGLFISLISISTSVIDNIAGLAEGLGDLAREIMDMDYYKKFMALTEYNEPAYIPEYSEHSTYSSRIYPEIVFENVKFTYPNTDTPVLNGVNFTIKPNESVGIVGVNGAGKSTVIKLLCKLYKPDEGRILIGGIDLQELPYENLRKIFGVVFQDYFRYELTLRENLAFGNLEKLHDDEALNEAINKSKSIKLINTINLIDKDAKNDKSNKGLDMNLGKLEEDGVDLSGGQWQRIAVGRVCLSNAPVIILDEPTAALDPIAESEMYSLFFDVMKVKNQRCTVMISHRLASSKMAQKIIVLNNGVVEESGTHDELMQSKKLYYKMFTEQASWYITEYVTEGGRE